MKNRIAVWLLVLAFFLTISGGAIIIDLYTEWLFFSELDYADVFTKVLSTRALLGLAGGFFALVLVSGNIIIANRNRISPLHLLVFDNQRVALDIGRLSRWNKPLTVLSGVAAAFIGAAAGSSLWEEVLSFQNRIAMGVIDPVFGRDIGFYLFQLPLLDAIRGLTGFLLFAALLLVSVSYFIRGGMLPKGTGVSIDPGAKKHLSILTGLLIIVAAAGFYLDQFHLLLSSHTIITGAGYTDVHARLPVLRLLSVLTAASGVLFFVGVSRGAWKIAAFPLLLTALVYLAGFMAYPSLLQNLKVTPNELALERKFVEHHIKFTRFGYDLEGIEVRPFDVSYTLTSGDIERNNATIKNIRLWDDSPLLRTYSQLQQIRTYYKFVDVDNDRYTINGEYMQVMLSPRELSYNDLPSKSWINERMVFTHGFGIAMGPVSRISGEGLPEFLIKDIPPISSGTVKVTRPEIYYGELSSDYVVVKTNVPEFNYPTSEGNVSTSYAGKGGIGLSSLFRKAVFAIKVKTAKLVLSSDITPQSKILYKRSIAERVRTVAPFLLYDKDPYIVVSDEGKLFWILDAYTYSGRVPYSSPLGRNAPYNYIRNSVKVVVDAYNGTVDFYISDPDDVLIKVYRSIFPRLFKPLPQMPDDLRKHIRYPKGFLQVQAQMYSSYHMTDPKVFYNKEDLWELPTYGKVAIEPYYTIMKLPGEKKEEYILLLPYTPSKRDNLAAWLAARCDEPNYGKLIVYTFPRDRLVFGPKQIDARIDQDSYIAQQLTLWGQRGSQVIRGSLLVIPIEGSLLYVQPLYLAAEDKGLPELRRVILAYENNVVMEENLELGLQRLFSGRRVVPQAREKVVETPGGSVPGLAKEAMRVYERANESMRRGDWAGYGENLRQLEQILRRMARQE